MPKKVGRSLIEATFQLYMYTCPPRTLAVAVIFAACAAPTPRTAKPSAKTVRPVETEVELQQVLAGFKSFRLRKLPADVFEQDGYSRSHRRLKVFELSKAALEEPLIGHRSVREFVSLEYRWLGRERYAEVAPDGDYRYAVWDPKLLRKFLLIRQALLSRGMHPERLRIFSVHRTPRVNEFLRGINVNTARKSYHMKGMAIDIVHADLNDDGQVDETDHRLLIDTVTQIERDHPVLRGGLGVYTNNIHTDTRRRCAFWCGKGKTAGALCGEYETRCRDPHWRRRTGARAHVHQAQTTVGDET